MFEAIVGGISWGCVAGPLVRDISPIMGLLLCFYVTMSIFVVMNLVTGLFVERVTKMVSEDKDQDMALQITQFFFPEGVDDEITIDDFKEKLESHTETIMEYFHVSPEEVDALFQLIDADGSNEVSAAELVDGCLKLRGPAKSVEVAIMGRKLT